MPGNIMKKKRKSKNIYSSAITYDNIYNMWKIIKRTCKNKREVFLFSLNLNTNIHYIYHMLKTKTYKPSQYRTFLIFEPKPRLVMSQTITDKIINHFVANYYLIPYMENSLIDSNVATRKNKGSSYAMKLIKKYYNKILINEQNKEIYALKIDVSKYFYTIDHEILLKKIQNKIEDKDVLNLIKIIISEANNDYVNISIKNYNDKFNTSIPYYQKGKGLSIGAMTSQFLAIFYLNDLDHYIKENLKCKYYIRYMDDFLILDTDKDRLKKIQTKIFEELEKTKLNVNEKSNIYKSSSGYVFLGYKYKVVNNKLKILFNKKTYYKIKRKLKYLYAKNKIQYNKSLASYYGYFTKVLKLKEINFKMKLIDKYKTYKDKYENTLVIIKEGIFYKTFEDDAKILWYIFDYKYVNDSVSFGNSPYDKVILKLNKLDISYIILDKDEIVLSHIRDEDAYLSYKSLSIKSYNQLVKTENLINKLQTLMNNKPECYEKVNSMLDAWLEN
jgi:RNA-directed DNA polymerase